MSFFMSKGYVYILSNPAMPGIYKVGRSINGGSIRAKALFTTGVPSEFNLEFEIFSKNHKEAEIAAHEALDRYRCSENREFFKCDIETAIQEVTSACISDYELLAEASTYVAYLPDLLFLSHKNDVHLFPLMEAISMADDHIVKEMMKKYNAKIERLKRSSQEAS